MLLMTLSIPMGCGRTFRDGRGTRPFGDDCLFSFRSYLHSVGVVVKANQINHGWFFQILLPKDAA